MHSRKPSNFGNIHVYTGDGKGKTTAAIGLTIRALGAQKNVLFAQLLKQHLCSESLSLERFAGRLDWLQYSTGRCEHGVPSEKDCREAVTGIEEINRKMHTGNYDMVVLDGLNVAVHMGLLPLRVALQVIDDKPSPVELVLTGRYAPKEFINRAHLVTEMKEIKHYCKKGVEARIGIEK